MAPEELAVAGHAVALSQWHKASHQISLCFLVFGLTVSACARA